MQCSWCDGFSCDVRYVDFYSKIYSFLEANDVNLPPPREQGQSSGCKQQQRVASPWHRKIWLWRGTSGTHSPNQAEHGWTWEESRKFYWIYWLIDLVMDLDSAAKPQERFNWPFLKVQITLSSSDPTGLSRLRQTSEPLNTFMTHTHIHTTHRYIEMGLMYPDVRSPQSRKLVFSSLTLSF